MPPFLSVNPRYLPDQDYVKQLMLYQIICNMFRLNITSTPLWQSQPSGAS